MRAWILAFHLVAMVAWFAALFYLPRLFVYHADSRDTLSLERFKVMERRLYYGIMWPAAIVTTSLGFWLLSFNLHDLLNAGWMKTKLALVALLWIYHLYCGTLMRQFARDSNQHRALFYRFFNEVPTLILIAIMIVIFVKP